MWHFAVYLFTLSCASGLLWDNLKWHHDEKRPSFASYVYNYEDTGDSLDFDNFQDYQEIFENSPALVKTSIKKVTPVLRKNATCVNRPVLTKKPGDYNYHPGIGTYKLHPEGLPWFDAQEVCCAEGGELAFIDSQAEADLFCQIFVQNRKSLTGTENRDEVILGFYDSSHKREWETVDGRILANDDPKWYPERTDNSAHEFCGTMICFPNGGLKDFPCNQHAAFFCEIPESILDKKVLDNETKREELQVMQKEQEERDSVEEDRKKEPGMKNKLYNVKEQRKSIEESAYSDAKKIEELDNTKTVQEQQNESLDSKEQRKSKQKSSENDSEEQKKMEGWNILFDSEEQRKSSEESDSDTIEVQDNTKKGPGQKDKLFDCKEQRQSNKKFGEHDSGEQKKKEEQENTAKEPGQKKLFDSKERRKSSEESDSDTTEEQDDAIKGPTQKDKLFDRKEQRQFNEKSTENDSKKQKIEEKQEHITKEPGQNKLFNSKEQRKSTEESEELDSESKNLGEGHKKMKIEPENHNDLFDGVSRDESEKNESEEQNEQKDNENKQWDKLYDMQQRYEAKLNILDRKVDMNTAWLSKEVHEIEGNMVYIAEKQMELAQSLERYRRDYLDIKAEMASFKQNMAQLNVDQDMKIQNPIPSLYVYGDEYGKHLDRGYTVSSMTNRIKPGASAFHIIDQVEEAAKNLYRDEALLIFCGSHSISDFDDADIIVDRLNQLTFLTGSEIYVGFVPPLGRIESADGVSVRSSIYEYLMNKLGDVRGLTLLRLSEVLEDPLMKSRAFFGPEVMKRIGEHLADLVQNNYSKGSSKEDER